MLDAFPVFRLLADVMEYYVSSGQAHVRNSSDLVDKLKKDDLEHGELVTLDVVSLFTNVPLVEFLRIFHNFIVLCMTRPSESVLFVLGLISWTLRTLFSPLLSLFNTMALFIQNDGVAMENSLSCIFIIIFEELVLSHALQSSLCCPSLWLPSQC